MVGAKSVGCSTCKRRKIKCDERFPICANCERGKRDCSGPKTRFIRFIAPGNEQHIRDAAEITLSHPPSCSRSESLAARLAARLDGIKEIGYRLQTIGIFFPYIVPRIGHSPALDAAVRCVLGVHQNLISGNETSRDQDLMNYNHSLVLIRKDLNCHQSRATPETICASMLLCRYELLEKNTPGYITHAGGVSALIEAWGPNRINSEFELTLFRCHYGAILLTCLFTGKKCFLATPTWDAVRIKCMGVRTKIPFDHHLSDLLAVIATLPNLLERLQSQTTNPNFSPIHEARRFKAKLSKLEPAISRDLENPTLVMECLGSPSSCMPTYYNFSSYMIAGRYSMYWASVIIANSILLRQGETDSALVEEYQFAADQIFKSIEYFRQHKPFVHSAIATIATLAMLFGVSSMDRREWIVQEMQDLCDPQPPEFWRGSLQFIFDVLTGARKGQLEGFPRF